MATENDDENVAQINPVKNISKEKNPRRVLAGKKSAESIYLFVV